MTNSSRVNKTMSRKLSNKDNEYRSERDKKHDRSPRVNRRNWDTSGLEG